MFEEKNRVDFTNCKRTENTASVATLAAEIETSEFYDSPRYYRARQKRTA